MRVSVLPIPVVAASFEGTGDVTEAASFRCVAP